MFTAKARQAVYLNVKNLQVLQLKCHMCLIIELENQTIKHL